MKNHDRAINCGNYHRQSYAALLSVGIVALMASGEFNGASAAGPNPPKAEKSVVFKPEASPSGNLVTIIDYSLMQLKREINNLHHQQRAGVWVKRVTLDDLSLGTEYSISRIETNTQTNLEVYEQLVVNVKDGAKIPYSAILVNGAPEPKYVPGEDMPQYTQLNRFPEKSGYSILVEDYTMPKSPVDKRLNLTAGSAYSKGTLNMVPTIYSLASTIRLANQFFGDAESIIQSAQLKS